MADLTHLPPPADSSDAVDPAAGVTTRPLGLTEGTGPVRDDLAPLDVLAAHR